MKRFVALFFLLFVLKTMSGQEDKADSLQRILSSSKDTAKAIVLNQLAENYLSGNRTLRAGGQDSLLHIALVYAQQAEDISHRLQYVKGMGIALFNTGNIMIASTNVDYSSVLPSYIAALPLLKKSGDKERIATCYMKMADCYHMMGKIEKAVACYDTCKERYLQVRDSFNYVIGYGMMGHCYHDKGDYKKSYDLGSQTLAIAMQKRDTFLTVFALAHLSSLFLDAGLPQITIDYLHKILALRPHALDAHDITPLPYATRLGLLSAGQAYIKLGEIDSALVITGRLKPDTTDSGIQLFYGNLSKALGKKEEALAYFLNEFGIEQKLNHTLGIARQANELGRMYLELKDIRLAKYYASQALSIAQGVPMRLEMRNAIGTLNDIAIETKNYEQVYQYSKWYKSLNDSIAPEEYRQKLSLVQIQAELDNQKQQALLLSKDNEIKQQALSKAALLKKIFSAGLVLLVLIAGIILFSYRQKRRANILLQSQKEEIETTLSELKSTQQQLVQAEKMASLGQLTAGIAHEIQNPLNFVNNFAEVNTELLEELQSERLKQNDLRNLATEDELVRDIADNSSKIKHHGKRADAIVKGMLEHSKAGTGPKEPTDINAFCEEYLRFSYQAIKAKNKNFDVAVKTNYDDKIGILKVVAPDFVRVIVNVYNNAFYAVAQKRKLHGEYAALVSVTTKRWPDKIEINIADNGTGIREDNVQKIFQPFFTTKPTGEGTGLGLSLSYNIITALGGQISVASKEGEGTVFSIYLPIA